MIHTQNSTYATDWLKKRSQLTPDKIGLQDANTGEQISFKTWNGNVNRTANFLIANGIKKGDRVSVYATNCIEYLDILFACGKIGAILHNVSWRLTISEIKEIIADATPRLLIYSEEWVEQVKALHETDTGIERFIGIKRQASPIDLIFSERKKYSPESTHKLDLSMDDPWGIYYTGGTTGMPKGAILTHGNLTWNSINTITSWGISREDSALLQLPLFHIGGPNIFMIPLLHVGGKTILCKQFEIEQTFDLLENGGITHFVGVPTMYIMMQQHPRWQKADFSKLKLVISGGAPCPYPVMKKFWDKGIDFKMGYGLTEASGNNFWLPQQDVQKKIGSVGFPNFHIDMKIIKGNGDTCKPGEDGELLIKGPHVTPGYWNRPEATKAALKDGWLHSGDVARKDKDGYFYIIGRNKDMFISGGENVYPAEVESIIHSHPAVAEAALIGIPHEKWGEVGKAFVVPQKGKMLSEQELHDFLSNKLAKYKIPHVIVIIEKIPKTAIGKIDKNKLRSY